MPTADRNLLFGILALQHNFISRDALLAAFSTWVADKSRDLGSLLHARNELTAKQQKLLTELVEECIQQLGSAEVCLEKLSSISAVRDDLESLRDSDLQASLRHVSRPAQVAFGEATTLVPPSVGATSAVGTRFRILRPHAEGGLGVVSVAHDDELNREVALKEIKGKFADDPDSRARFTLEAEITGGLEHPGIVPVYGLGKYADGRPFYAMRFIRGDSLNTAIQEFHAASQLTETERNLRLRRLLQRFIDVCEAMHYAHSRGVLHRDLKPSNIMLGKYGETLVVDWGLARTGSRDASEVTKSLGSEPSLQPKSGSSATITGEAVGTPAFMSPEQAAGKLDLLGPATDIYALGATLYTILAGRPPIEGKTTGELLQNSQQGRIVPLRQRRRRVPPALEAICLRALATEPAARYARAQQLAEEVEHWLADEPVAAYREPLVARARRELRRRPMIAGSIVTTLFVGLVALGIGWSIVGSKNRELSQTNANLISARKTAIEQRNEAKRQEAIALTQKKAAEDNATLATLNAEQAAAEQERLKKALDFFTASFRKTTPEQDGRELKAADLLVSAAQDAQNTFADEPVIQSQILDALSDILSRLGLVVEALPLAETALRVREESLGPDDEATLSSLSDLATTYNWNGKHAQALALFTESVRRYEAKYGPEHLKSIREKERLAAAYVFHNQAAKALPLYEEVVPQFIAQRGAEHPETVTVMVNLANAYRSNGQIDKALPLYEELMPRIQQENGPDHPFTLGTTLNLAMMYRTSGQLEKSIALSEETLPRLQAKLGTDHVNTLVAMRELSAAYYDARALTKALPLYEATVQKFRTKFGVGHHDTLASMKELADLYRETGQLDKALPLYEETVRGYQKLLGTNHYTTLGAMNNLMASYFEKGQSEKAIPIYREILAANRTRVRPESLELADVLANGALELFKIKAWGPAEETAREELELRERLEPNDWKTFCARALLGATLVSRGGDLMALDKSAGEQLLVEGEQLILAGRQGILERKDQMPAAGKLWLTNSTQWLIKVYTFRENPAEAAKWRAELDKLNAEAKN